MYRIAKIGQQIGLAVTMMAVLLSVNFADAQLTVGDNVHLTMDGSLGYGYTGAFGNYIQSSHGQVFGANGNLNGDYFNPNFLSFNVRPYFNRASSDSESQSIARGTGFGSSVAFFGGSHFPGSVSYGMDFTNNSEFYVAGVPSVLGDASGRTFGVSWSELLPDLPHLYFSYISTNSTSNLLSTNEENHSASKNLNLTGDYRLAGWTLQGNINHNTNHFTTPQFLTGETIDFAGSGTNYGVNAQHKIPLGSLSLGWTHADYGTDNDGHGSSNVYSEGTGFFLLNRLTISQNFNYATNTSAALSQSVLNGNLPLNLRDRDSDSLFFGTSANLRITKFLSATGYFNHRLGSSSESSFSDSQYGGSVNFNQQSRFLGFITFSVGLIDTASKEGNNGAGLVASVAMNRKIFNWDTSADFSYYQNMQTLYTFATTSSYSYGGSARKKINSQMRWGVSYRASHSGLTMQEGNSNQSENISTFLSWKRYTLGANYSQSSGLAVLTSSGNIIATPVSPILTSGYYVFNARNVGVNGTTRLFHRVNVGGGYSKVHSDTISGPVATLANGNRYYATFQYLLRRFEIQGSYNRINQDVSSIPGGPRVTNSYYITLSRWFNVF